MQLLTNTVLVEYEFMGNEFTTSTTSTFIKRRKNMCNCNLCKSNLMKSTGYTVGAKFAIATGFTEPDVDNGKCYRLVLCANLPSMSTIVPVTLGFNTSSLPVMDRIGNNLMSDQLHTRKCYNLVYGANPPHFLVTNCIPNSANIPVDETSDISKTR